MDTALEAMLAIAILSAVHERFIEAIRGALADSELPWLRKLVAQVTIGPWSFVLSVGMAVATNANLLSLFGTTGGQQAGSAFYAGYLHTWPDSPRSVFGCLLMGLCAALGSKFWHDLAYGLIDLRTTAKSLPSMVSDAAAPAKGPPIGGAPGAPGANGG